MKRALELVSVDDMGCAPKKSRIDGEEEEVGPWAELLPELLRRIVWPIGGGALLATFGDGGMGLAELPLVTTARRPTVGNGTWPIPPGHQTHLKREKCIVAAEKMVRHMFCRLVNVARVCKGWFAAIDWHQVCDGIRTQFRGIRVARVVLYLHVLDEPAQPSRPPLEWYTRACLALALTPRGRESVELSSSLNHAAWIEVAMDLRYARAHFTLPQRLSRYVMGSSLRTMELLASVAQRVSDADIQSLLNTGHGTRTNVSANGTFYFRDVSFSDKYKLARLNRVVAIWDYETHRRIILSEEGELPHELLVNSLAWWRKSEEHYADMDTLYRNPNPGKTGFGLGKKKDVS